MYGFDDIDLEALRLPFAALADTPAEWRVIFGQSLQSIRTFLAVHDGFEVLAKCTNQVRATAAFKEENPRWPVGNYEPFMLMEPAELEVVQALALMQVSPRKSIPASPRNMARLLAEIPKCAYAFLRMQPLRHPNNTEREHVIGKIRIQTMLRRNLFDEEDCETVIRSIFRLVDDLTIKELGFSFSEMFSALIALAANVEQRLNAYLDKCRDGPNAVSEADALKSIEFFCDISPVARRAWAKCGGPLHHAC